MSMARPFTVFQDSPADPKSVPSSSKSEVPSSPAASTVPAATLTEKENLHPLTGERTATSITAGKKRKTDHVVLATKLYTLPSTKKQKELKEKPETKKRKSSSSSKAKVSTVGKRESRKSLRSGRRLSPSLPKVDEDVEVEKERVEQAEVDSKCYDLTVLPLADVTQAYDESPASEDVPSEENTKLRPVRESSSEPPLRDYFSPPLSAASLPSCPPSKRNISPQKNKEAALFSTPERKRIYSAFTFASPSPSAQRFSKSMGPVAGIELTLASP